MFYLAREQRLQTLSKLEEQSIHRTYLTICVNNLWRVKEGKIHIREENQSKCLDCAACYQVCNSGAIKFQYPKGGTGIVIEKG
jgi:ferredoxin-like protein FixX